MDDIRRPVGRPRKEQPMMQSAPQDMQQAPLEQAPSDDRTTIVRLSPTPELNPRSQILADIAARSNAQADADAAETIPGMESDAEENVINEASPDSAADDEPLSAEDQGAHDVVDSEVIAAPEFSPDQEYDLIVEGKPIKVKGSQILERGKAAIQKESAADYKLEMATRLLEEARATAKPAVVEEQPKMPTASELAEIIQFGTKEQAASAISMVIEMAQQGNKSQDMASVLPAVVSDQIAFHDATLFVQSEYKDLMSDPDLRSLFFMKENGMRQAGDNRSYKELYKFIGDELRVKFNRPAPAIGKTIEQKKEAKAAAPSAPRLASARLEAAAEKKPATTQEVIDKMRAARGQRPHATVN